MRYFAVLFLFLAACAAPIEPEFQVADCKWPEIPSNGGCCRDLNENGICDTTDLAKEIEQQKQEEYEAASKKALETAKKSGNYRRTIVNELYDNASKIKNYRFVYNGDEVVVANGSTKRKLINEYDLGIKEIEGRRQKIILNEVDLDFISRTATGTCIPSKLALKEEYGTPCDAIMNMKFEVPYDKFAFTPPINWVKDFLFRTPFEALPGTEIGRQKTTLFRFTSLQDANKKTNVWIDSETNLPVRVEVWQDNKLVRKEYYTDLRII